MYCQNCKHGRKRKCSEHGRTRNHVKIAEIVFAGMIERERKVKIPEEAVFVSMVEYENYEKNAK